jgi:hypothetical protein
VNDDGVARARSTTLKRLLHATNEYEKCARKTDRLFRVISLWSSGKYE